MEIDLSKKDYHNVYISLDLPLWTMLEIQVDLHEHLNILLEV